MTQAEEAFLADLTQLTQKHKIIIGGCGCCGSPSLTFQEEINIYGHYIINKSYANEVVFAEPDTYYWKANNVVLK